MPKPGRSGEELWMRCPHCGDSSNSESVHYSVHVSKLLFHCFRCGENGRLTTSQFVQLTGTLPGAISLDDEARESVEGPTLPIRSGQGTSRSSALDRHHVSFQQKMWDVFSSRTPTGTVKGLSLRNPDGSLSFGRRALGFRGPELVTDFVRLVEGPYDVVDPFHDVCTFGFPTRAQLNMLRPYPLLLCPDGDVWTDDRKLKAYLRPFHQHGGLAILGAEVLPDGMDPDELEPKYRERVSEAYVRYLMRSLCVPLRTRRGPRFHAEYLPPLAI